MESQCTKQQVLRFRDWMSKVHQHFSQLHTTECSLKGITNSVICKKYWVSCLRQHTAVFVQKLFVWPELTQLNQELKQLNPKFNFNSKQQLNWGQRNSLVVGLSCSDRYTVTVALMACLDHVLNFVIQCAELIHCNTEHGLYLDVQLNMHKHLRSRSFIYLQNYCGMK